jgi:hypothetical protein
MGMVLLSLINLRISCFLIHIMCDLNIKPYSYMLIKIRDYIVLLYIYQKFKRADFL